MRDDGFGQVRGVDVRELWQHEERDFTPWLLNNKDRLEAVLGLDIELDGREHAVGSFELDLIGRDTSDGSPVIIENQLEGSDHRHLGQLLTYAGGVGASTVIWIATSFTEPHRSALEWLNEHTVESVRFFAVELRAIRVDDSRPAPIFEVVVRPNDWERRVAAVRSTERSERQEAYVEFWADFLAAARERGWTAARSPQPQQWMSTPSGISGLTLNASFGRRGMSAELYFQHPDPERNLARFTRLSSQRERFESAYGGPIEWQELPGRSACRIADYLADASIEDRASWGDFLSWQLDRQVRLRSALEALGGTAYAVGEA